MARKISELGNFSGKDLLLAAQKRGVEIMPLQYPFEATSYTLIGLADILAENNIGGINEIVAKMEKAK